MRHLPDSVRKKGAESVDWIGKRMEAAGKMGAANHIRQLLLGFVSSASVSSAKIPKEP